MPLPEEIREELEAMRQRLLEMLIPLQTPEPVEDTTTEEERLRRALWSAIRELDPMLSGAHALANLDLTVGDETIREALYNFVVREHFSPHLLDDAGDVFIPGYTPEQGELKVYFQLGRWFVTWIKLEEDMNRPEALSRELLVYEKNEDGQLIMTEI